MNFSKIPIAGFWLCTFFYWMPVSAGEITRDTFPRPESASELVLLGPGKIPSDAISKGSWPLKSGQLIPKDKAESGNSFWLVPVPAANGTIRARLVYQRIIRASLLFRALPDKNRSHLIQGFLLEIDHSFAWLSKVKGEQVSPLGHKVWLPGMSSRKKIELEIFMFGPHLVANIYDADSNRTLGILSSDQVSSRTGFVGMFLDRDHKTSAALDFLSWRSACSDIPAGNRGEPVVYLSPTSQMKQTENLATFLETTGKGKNQAAFRTDQFGLERIFCEKFTVHQVTTDLPWKYLDLNFLEYQKASAQKPSTIIEPSRSYKDPAMINSILQQFHRNHPRDTLLRKIGTSIQGRPIFLLAIGHDIHKKQNRPSILLSAAIHGDEILSIELVLDVIQMLLEPAQTNSESKHWLDEFNVFCVPLVNPDGLFAFIHQSLRAGRKNGRDVDGNGLRDFSEGVDINRNFPFRWGTLKSGANPESRYYHGKKSASEPETQALIRLANQEKFLFSISYHLGNVVILAPYTTGKVPNPVPNEAWLVADELSRELPRHPEGSTFHVRQQIYPVDGVEQDFYRYAHGTVALLVEAGNWPPPIEPRERQSIIEVLRPCAFFLMNRFSQGPSISVTVHKKDSTPAEAEIRFQELVNNAQEVWTTRTRDGSYHRFLPFPGTYHLSVHVPGITPIERTIQVSTEHSKIDITLPQ